MKVKVWIQLVVVLGAVGILPRMAQPQDLRRPTVAAEPTRETIATPTRDTTALPTRETAVESRSTPDAPTQLFSLESVTAFDGNQRIGTEVTAQLGDFTVEVWFKDDRDNKQYERLADKSYQHCLWLGRNSATPNSWGGGVMEGSDPYGIFVTLQDGDLHQLVSVRQGGMHYIYGDGGAVVASAPVSAAACDATPFAIGAFGDPTATQQRFTGEISSATLFNRALTLDEVKSRYDRRTTARPTAPDTTTRDAIAPVNPARETPSTGTSPRDNPEAVAATRDNQPPATTSRDNAAPDNPAPVSPTSDNPVPDATPRDGAAPVSPTSPTRDNQSPDTSARDGAAPVNPVRDSQTPGTPSRDGATSVTPTRDSPVPATRSAPSTAASSSSSRTESGNTRSQGFMPTDLIRSYSSQQGVGEVAGASSLRSSSAPMPSSAAPATIPTTAPKTTVPSPTTPTAPDKLGDPSKVGTQKTVMSISRDSAPLQKTRLSDKDPFEPLAQRSAAIIQGKIITSTPRQVLIGTEKFPASLVFTDYIVSVTETLKGQGVGAQIAVTMPGGCVGQVCSRADVGELQPEEGKSYILFLEKIANSTVWRVTNGRGIVSVDRPVDDNSIPIAEVRARVLKPTPQVKGGRP